MTEMVLARLGYDPGPVDATLDSRTEQALRAYQKNRGVPITGDPLSFETFKAIGADLALLEASPVSLPSQTLFFDDWDRGYVLVRGTWTIANEDQASPEQTSELQCFKDEMTCRQATALIMSGMLNLWPETHVIERWDHQEIVTKPDEKICVRYVVRINRVQKSVTGIRSTISNDTVCKHVEANERRPRRAVPHQHGTRQRRCADHAADELAARREKIA